MAAQRNKKTVPVTADETIASEESTYREREQYLDALRSLDEAVVDAGGTVLTAEQIMTMTVNELLDYVGPNSIRFVFKEEN